MGAALFIAVVGGSSLYVVQPAASNLRAARALLSTAPGDLDARTLIVAAGHLEEARARLRSLPGRLLGLLPIARQNIAAVDEVSSHAISVLEGGSDLATMVDGNALVADGALDLDRLAVVAERATDTARSLDGLLGSIEQHRSGWLVPPLWHSIVDLTPAVAKLHADLDRAAAFLRAAPTILGADEERIYLVMLMNNAELRGSGGIPSGIGTLAVTDGGFSLGSFDYYRELATHLPHIERVQAPREFTTRYARYRANSTYLVNSTMSPDVPEVALVVSRLYRKVTGIRADGVLFADPHGIASLIPDKQRVRIPGLHEPLRASEIARFVYSDAYEVFEDSNRQRRDALLAIGESAFSGLAYGEALRSLDPSAVVAAAGGGHIRFVSFDPREASLLDRAKVSGDLVSPADDSVFVTVQNFGGDKLDYWVERTISHDCRVTAGGAASCATEVRLENDAPNRLTDYVTQQKRNAMLQSFLEIYVPQDARISGMSLNGKDVRYSLQREDERVAAGVFIELARGRTATLRADYELEIARDGYSLELTPQPLARPARVEVRLRMPETWTLTMGRAERRGATFHYEGELDTTLFFEAGPTPQPSGVTGLWDRIERFWRDPVELG